MKREHETGTHMSIGGRSRRLGRRGLTTMLLALFVLATLGAVAYAAVAPTKDDQAAEVLRASGRLRIRNNHGGDALVGMLGMLPGDRTTGTVKIGNASKVRARFYLGLSKLMETPGAAGGRLSSRLVLVVKRIRQNRRPRVLYCGPIREMPLLKLGTFSPRSARQYRITVLFPEGGSGVDNRYQEASLSLQFTWYARQAR